MLNDKSARLWARAALDFLQRLWDREDEAIPSDPAVCATQLLTFYDGPAGTGSEPEETPAWLQSFAARFPDLATSWEARFLLYGKLRELAAERGDDPQADEVAESQIETKVAFRSPTHEETDALLAVLGGSSVDSLAPPPSESFLKTMESVRSPWSEGDKVFLKKLHERIRSTASSERQRDLANLVAALMLSEDSSREDDTATGLKVVREFLEGLTPGQRNELAVSVAAISHEFRTTAAFGDSTDGIQARLEELIREEPDRTD